MDQLVITPPFLFLVALAFRSASVMTANPQSMQMYCPEEFFFVRPGLPLREQMSHRGLGVLCFAVLMMV